MRCWILEIDQRHYQFKPPPSGGLRIWAGWVQPRSNSLDAGSRSGGLADHFCTNPDRSPSMGEYTGTRIWEIKTQTRMTAGDLHRLLVLPKGPRLWVFAKVPGYGNFGHRPPKSTKVAVYGSDRPLK